ncbi:MAG: GNAT family N-acetyltransferase [Steroidobacteraceae bacterium]
MSTILETARLRLRELQPEDAPFILELLNDAGWLKYIGDRGVHDLATAVSYIEGGPREMYLREGFGLWLVESREAPPCPMGLCGLLRRPWLDHVDIGFAFLERYRGEGLAREAAAATLDYARRVLGLQRVVAVTLPGNARSRHLLESLGMRELRRQPLPDDGDEVVLYG